MNTSTITGASFTFQQIIKTITGVVPSSSATIYRKINKLIAAGTGTLFMALAHQIGEDRCTIFSQDISQRSNKMLKLNLILNNLVSSLDHAIQGDTLVSPYHKSDDGKELRQFDFVVSNPPFKMDFSDTREKIAAMPARFWAGVPNIPKAKKKNQWQFTPVLFSM